MLKDDPPLCEAPDPAQTLGEIANGLVARLSALRAEMEPQRLAEMFLRGATLETFREREAAMCREATRLQEACAKLADYCNEVLAACEKRKGELAATPEHRHDKPKRGRGRPSLPGRLEFREKKWWIVEGPDNAEAIGPYDKREEAADDLKGLRRTWKETERKA
jgi:hypothetical protein